MFKFVLLFVIACSPESEDSDTTATQTQTETQVEPEPEPDSTTPTETQTVTETETQTETQTETKTQTETETETETKTEEEVIDCATAGIPSADLVVTEIDGGRGYHGLVIDPQGRLVGSNNSTMWRVDSLGNTQSFGPALGVLDQMDILPNGDIVFAAQNDSSIKRITPSGGVEVIVGGIAAYGVKLGPDGLIYAADNSKLIRFSPEGNAAWDILWSGDMGSGSFPRVLDWSPDLSRLYIGSRQGGRVFYMELDENLDPISDPILFATGIGSAYQDGLGVDVCGNVYIPDYSTGSLWKITHDGTVSNYWNAQPFEQYGHGIEWGTWGDNPLTDDGWGETAIYVPQPYNGNHVAEIEIGIPYRTWPGTVINAPWQTE